MSLQFWLPLNGNITNQGLNTLTATNTNATISDDGILKQSYYFDGASSRISFPSVTLPYPISISVWFKSEDIASVTNRYIISYDIAKGGTIGHNIGIGSYNGKLVIWHGGKMRACSTVLEDNLWHHAVAIVDVNYYKLYLNGELVLYDNDEYQENKNSRFITIGARNNAADGGIGGASYYFKGYINDVRIYNHALSAKEVEELSKGLILHYKLTNNIPLNILQYDKNIYIEPDGSQWVHLIHHNNPANAVFASSDNFLAGVYKDEDRWFDFCNIINYLDKYEFMIKQKSTSDATEVKYRWIQQKNPLIAAYEDVVASQVTRITTSGYTDGTFGGIYILKDRTYLCIANASEGNWWGALGSWTTYQGGIPGYPTVVITTGYIDLYVKISDYQKNKIYDCSGYNNNGNILGNLTIDYNSARYNNSIIFNGISSMIEADGLPAETQTIAAWIKLNDGTTSNYNLAFHDKQSKLAIGYYSNKITTYIGTAVGGDGSQAQIALNSNKWYHIVVVKTGETTRDTYVNGEKITSIGHDYWAGDLNKLYIGGRHAGGSYQGYFNGQISDIRAYATTLTEAQVKELYNTSASIDSFGNLYLKEYDIGEYHPIINYTTVATRERSGDENAGEITWSINLTSNFSNGDIFKISGTLGTYFSGQSYRGSVSINESFVWDGQNHTYTYTGSQSDSYNNFVMYYTLTITPSSIITSVSMTPSSFGGRIDKNLTVSKGTVISSSGYNYVAITKKGTGYASQITEHSVPIVEISKNNVISGKQFYEY